MASRSEFRAPPTLALPTDPMRRALHARSVMQNVTENTLQQAPDADVSSETVMLDRVPFSETPFYSYREHCEGVGRLALVLGQTLGLKDRDLRIVRYAGILHDLGRSQPWQRSDPDHGQLSARLADEALRRDPQYGADSAFRDEVCRLIAGHNLSAADLPKDPKAMALWDADALDSARFSPNTRDGIVVFKERTTRLCTVDARAEDVQLRWRKYRKWVG